MNIVEPVPSLSTALAAERCPFHADGYPATDRSNTRRTMVLTGAGSYGVTDVNAGTLAFGNGSLDLRLGLLMTFMGDEPTAVRYEAIVPGTPIDKAWQVVSPVGSATFDRVTRLPKPR